jgi:lipid-A-disaccharide synthase
MAPYSILLLAGEASGDYHAAALVRDLKRMRPDIRVSGIGGDKLAAAGMELLHHYRDVNTIGLSEGLSNVRNILAAYKDLKRELRSGKHDLFIPVDFPDLNIRLCGLSKRAGVPVCYYISPQIWAWRKGRIRKIAARVDRMMTIFPFEETLYREAGVRADFVGHTMVRDIPEHVNKSELRAALGMDPNLYTVALAPGSRPAEIRRMLPVMASAGTMYAERFPDTQFVLPLAGDHLSAMVNEILAAHKIRVMVYPGEASSIMGASDSGLVTSGTATLQAALAGMPHAVAYMLDQITWLIAIRVLKPLVMDKDIHVAIANVLAISAEKRGDSPIGRMLDAGFRIPCQECGRPLFVPELLQHQATAENLANWLVRFRSEPRLRDAMISGFEWIRRQLNPPEENRTAAGIVLDCIENKVLQ